MARVVTAVFDIGKTNKKYFLFNEALEEIRNVYAELPTTEDEDGYPCDDPLAIVGWIEQILDGLLGNPDFILRAVNFSTYGATLVHLDGEGKPVTPLYNYLKPFPSKLASQFQAAYGATDHDLATASPFLGMLNSGLQLYWLKYERPELFRKVRHTLHFPQYLSYALTGKMVTEPTSVGCHTKLWDFNRSTYHSWVKEEGFLDLFPDMVPTATAFEVTRKGKSFRVGVGIHDSSSALAAYLTRSPDPFLLVSTGTWSITMNPFTEENLTREELERDCLNYLTPSGNPVKASRLFLGHELDHQLKTLNRLFDRDTKYYKQIRLNPSFLRAIEGGAVDNLYYPEVLNNDKLVADVFRPVKWDPQGCASYEEAYHHVIWGLVRLQVASIRLALGRSPVKKVFVDGGFVDNELYITLLKHFLPELCIEASHTPLGSAYGAAAILE
ncbi:MAG TPA: FGGY family carbohydrate kinase [Cyclobacteriaceae bacterium]|nr:FGGY family carbohydrate kinase [Cyclobacteriaceae bacterium]